MLIGVIIQEKRTDDDAGTRGDGIRQMEMGSSAQGECWGEENVLVQIWVGGLVDLVVGALGRSWGWSKERDEEVEAWGKRSEWEGIEGESKLTPSVFFRLPCIRSKHQLLGLTWKFLIQLGLGRCPGICSFHEFPGGDADAGPETRPWASLGPGNALGCLEQP